LAKKNAGDEVRSKKLDYTIGLRQDRRNSTLPTSLERGLLESSDNQVGQRCIGKEGWTKIAWEDNLAAKGG